MQVHDFSHGMQGPFPDVLVWSTGIVAVDGRPRVLHV